MTRTEMLQKYARLLVKLGVNIQEGEYLVLEADAENYMLTRYITELALKEGARDVIVHYRDAYVDKFRALMAQEGESDRVLPWQTESLDYYLRQKSCSLLLKTTYPSLLDDCGADAGQRLQKFSNDLRNIIRGHYRDNDLRWCIACVPNPDWAEALYPHLAAEKAYDKLWETLMSLCKVEDSNDPVEDWIAYSDTASKYSTWLNAKNIDHIRFTNSKGTDLTIGFNPKCHWVGGTKREDRAPNDNMGNIPSNEVASSPDKTRVDGRVYSSRPLIYGGQKIDDFMLTFEKGAVVDFHAELGEDLLEKLLSVDAGSRRIGEVAFVEADVPLAKTGLVFYNTLLDENAACHLALGNGYAICINGVNPSDVDDWERERLNSSSQHIDFMFGTEDMSAVGYTSGGEKIQIFKDGKFVI